MATSRQELIDSQIVPDRREETNMQFSRRRKLDATSLSKIRKAQGMSKRDIAVLKELAIELIDSTPNHRDYRLLAFHRRRKRTRWVNPKTGEMLEFRIDKRLYIRGDELPLTDAHKEAPLVWDKQRARQSHSAP